MTIDTQDIDVTLDEAILKDGECVGYITSGGYAHHSKTSVAIGFLPVALIEEGRQVQIEILGERRDARLITRTLFDPDNQRLRG